MKRTYSILLCLFTGLNLSAAGVQVDKESSSVAVDVNANPPHSFACDLVAYDTAIEIDPQTGELLKADLTFNLTDLETHNEKRDRKMFKWMDTDTYNKIHWSMISVEKTQSGMVAHGNLTMHGVDRLVYVPFEMQQTGDSVTFSGVADFNYMDFELPKIRLFIFTVKPDLHVRFNLQGTLAEK